MFNLGASEIVSILLGITLIIGVVTVVVLLGIKMISWPTMLNSNVTSGKKAVEGESIRASTSDRNRTVEKLQKETERGRLTLEELQERIDSAYHAITLGELAQLTRDLPSEDRE